jgi:hypothetical protein
LKRDALYEECQANGVPDDDFFVNLNITNCTLTGLPFQSQLDELARVLSNIESKLRGEISNIERDLYEVQDRIDFLVPKANSLRWACYVSAAFAILVDLVMLVLLYGVYLAWKRKLNKPFICIRNFAIIPVFLFLTFLVWLLVADFCVGSPNFRLLQVAYQGDLFSSATLQLIGYYLNECQGPTVNIVPGDTVDTISKVVNAIHALVEIVADFNEGEYLEECGIDISPLTFMADSVHFSLHIVANAMAGIQQLFLCSNFFPVYATIAYDGKYTCPCLIDT